MALALTPPIASYRIAAPGNMIHRGLERVASSQQVQLVALTVGRATWQQGLSRVRTWSAMRLRSAAPDLALLGLLVLLAPLYFWRLFAPDGPDRRYIAGGDFTEEFFPGALLIARILRQGELPLWNPLSYGGMPLAADPQQAVFYPLQWPVLLAMTPSQMAASFLAMEISTVAHLALAAAFMYLLARHLTGSRSGALLAGTTYGFSGFMLSYPIQQVPILRTAAWLPLCFLLLTASMERRSFSLAAAAGASMAMALLAGHPQTVLYELLALVALVVFHVYISAAGPPQRRHLVAIPLLFGVALLFFLALTAVQTVPAYEFGTLSDRSRPDYEFTAVGYSFRELIPGILAPRLFDNYALYTGILPLLLAGLAVAVRRLPMVLFFAGLAAFGLLLSTGGHTFLNSILYLAVPGFSLFQHQERGIVLYVFSIAMLAGYGGAALAGRLSPRDRAQLRGFLAVSRRLVGGTVALVVIAYLMKFGIEAMGLDGKKWDSRVLEGLARLLVFGAASVAAVHLRARFVLGLRMFSAVALALLVLDLFSATWSQNTSREGPDRLYPDAPLLAALPHSPAVRIKNRADLKGNHGMVYGVASVDGTHALFPRWAVDVLEGIKGERAYLLYGATHVVSHAEGPAGARLVASQQARGRTYNLWEVRDRTGPALLVPEARVVESDEVARNAMASPEFDPRKLVLLAGPVDRPARLGGSGWAEIVGRTANTLEVRAQADGPAFLLITETYYPGWQAWVDGEPRPVVRANLAQRAVYLGPGEHRVRLVFDPPSFKLGLGISLVALLAFVMLVVALPVRSLARSSQPR